MVEEGMHERQALEVRRAIVSLLHAAGGGHFGGSLSLVDLLLVLWRDILEHGSVSKRDRFVLSKGHGAPALYCTLVALGRLSKADLNGFGRVPSALPSHPELGRPHLCDFSTGSLGQGLSAALGMALMLRQHQRRAWVVLGDGECQEGQVWEAAMLAARLNVSNLFAIIDCNGLQEWGYRKAPRTPVLELAAKWRAFGWRVAEVNGHDWMALLSTITKLRDEPAEAPTVILAHTVKGSGIRMAEHDPDRFHCTTLTDEEFGACLL